MLGYRAQFQVAERATVLDDSLTEFRAWLAGKGYDPEILAVDGKVVDIAPGVEASAFMFSTDDLSHSLRARVSERKSEGAWTSELTILLPADQHASAEVLLDIHSPADGEAQTMSTGVPRLARSLLGTLNARDSTARLTAQPIIVRSEDVQAVAAVINDPGRRGLMFVAGSADSLPLRAWSKLVGALVRQTTGLASAYVLDPDATERLATLLGPNHAVAPGTLRTFLPGVEPGSELDARRHRILSTTRIVNDRSHWLAAILGRRARENAVEAELPAHLRSVLDEIAVRADDALLGLSPAGHNAIQSALTTPQADILGDAPVRSEIVAESDAIAEVEDPEAIDGQSANPASPTAPTTPSHEVVSASDEAYLAASAVMHEILGISGPSPRDWADLAALARAGQKQADIAARLDELRNEVSQAGQERRNLARRLEDEQLEHAATFATLSDGERELRRLRALLLQTTQAEAVFVVPDGAAESDTPGSFVELLADVQNLPGIQFTGNESRVVGLDVHDPLGVWADKTWEILSALSDYAVASIEGRCDRDIHGYLLNVPDGCRGYSANKHAATESEDVHKNPRYAEARVFPVPTTVDPDGSVAMMGHFKIAQSGLISPRLHYYDDVTRTGVVYIGYIGPHLPTKRTN